MDERGEGELSQRLFLHRLAQLARDKSCKARGKFVTRDVSRTVYEAQAE